MDILVALDQRKNLFVLNGKLTREQLLYQYRETLFYCPQCNGEVRLKVGSIKIPHFAHVSKQICEGSSEGESAVHIQAKLQLYDWLVNQFQTNVELEKVYHDFNQRADIGLTINQNQFAIEFQRSSLSSIKFIERTIK